MTAGKPKPHGAVTGGECGYLNQQSLLYYQPEKLLPFPFLSPSDVVIPATSKNPKAAPQAAFLFAQNARREAAAEAEEGSERRNGPREGPGAKQHREEDPP